MEIRQPGNDKFTIHWMISSACNYHCSFCCNQSLSQYPSKSQIYKVANYIRKVLDKNSDKKFLIRLMGGEPSLWDLDELISIFYADNISSIRISTNLYRDSEFYLSLSKKYRVQIVASYHETEDKDIDAFIEKVNTLVKNNTKVTVRFVLTPDNVDILNYLNANLLVNVDPLAIQGDREYSYYGPTAKLEQMKSASKLLRVDGRPLSRYELLNEFNESQGYCTTKRIVIKPDGTLYVGNCDKAIFYGCIDEPALVFPANGWTRVCKFDKGLCSLNGASIIRTF